MGNSIDVFRGIHDEKMMTNKSGDSRSLRRQLLHFSQHLLLVLASLALVSCDHKGKLEGTYSSSVQSYTFKGGTATASIMGKKIGENWPYTVEGNKVTLNGPGGELVLTINADGSLSDPATDKLVKK